MRPSSELFEQPVLQVRRNLCTSVFHGIEKFGIDADSAGELSLRQTKPSTHTLFA